MFVLWRNKWRWEKGGLCAYVCVCGGGGSFQVDCGARIAF